MHVELYVSGKKVRFYANVGWYRGNDFAIFKFSLVNEFCAGSWSIISIQVAKWSFDFGFDL